MSLLRSDDIFATARTLIANGVDLLPIPDNYYDDIEAKTDLPSATIDALKALNILYERDGGREYFQLYTHSFANRFFFEIVERRDGYRGLRRRERPNPADRASAARKSDQMHRG